MRRTLTAFTTVGLLATGLSSATIATADPAHNPGGPCIRPDQNVSLASVAGYNDVVQALDRIERTSNGLVTVASAGQSGEGRELLYATVGSGPTTFWLQARIHGNELHSTEAALQILDLLDSDNPTARLIRENLTVVVIPMYNPDGSKPTSGRARPRPGSTSTGTGRTSPSPSPSPSGSCSVTLHRSWPSTSTTWDRRPSSTARTTSTSSRSVPDRSTRRG